MTDLDSLVPVLAGLVVGGRFLQVIRDLAEAEPEPGQREFLFPVERS